MTDLKLGTHVKIVNCECSGQFGIITHVDPAGAIQALYLVGLDDGSESAFWHDEVEELK